MISNKLDCIMIKSVVPPVLLFKEMASSSDKSGDSLRFLSSPFCTYSNAQHKRGHFVHILMLSTKVNQHRKPHHQPKKVQRLGAFGLGICVNRNRSSPKRKTSKNEPLNLVRYWPTIRPSCHRRHDEISIITLQLNNFEPLLRAIMLNTLAEVLHFRKLKCPKHSGELVGGMTKVTWVEFINDAFL